MRFQVLKNILLACVFAFGVVGALALSVAVASGQESDSVEGRAAAARAEHASALADWESRWVAYLEALREEAPVPPAPAPDPPPVPVVEEPAPSAEERFGFGFTYANDGSCRTNPMVATGSYAREAGNHDVHASVRVAPSGGDCTRYATSYSFTVERRYAVAAGWEVVGILGADGRSLHSLFDVYRDGEVMLRPDGNTVQKSEPVGFAATQVGALGLVTPAVGGFRLTAAVNVVPTDWANDTRSATAHFAASYDLGADADLALRADVRDADRHYGTARASWRPSIVSGIGSEITGEYSWGLDQLAGVGSPANPLGLDLRDPAVRSWAWTLGIGITF